MVNTQLYRKAISLAPECWPWDYYAVNPDQVDKMSQLEKDALATQLERQVRATGTYTVVTSHGWIEVCRVADGELVGLYVGSDVAEARLHAIIESKVLEKV